MILGDMLFVIRLPLIVTTVIRVCVCVCILLRLVIVTVLEIRMCTIVQKKVFAYLAVLVVAFAKKVHYKEPNWATLATTAPRLGEKRE